MTETRKEPTNYKILSIDGGGIRGVFPAAFLAKLEDHLDAPLASYFDLIAGTSTGGIIAIALGLGLTAKEILKLYEEQGPTIFDQQHGAVANFLLQRWRGARHLFASKYSSKPLHDALVGVLGDRRLGESRTRLVLPAWHPMLERVYIYKTAHHPRLETDYKVSAVDAAMATAAAPTFLDPHTTEDAIELVDGGVWANNPIGVASIEAIGMRSALSDLAIEAKLGSASAGSPNFSASALVIRCGVGPRGKFSSMYRKIRTPPTSTSPQ
jgi:patatin-like phospholipase/acyl hydrolase